MFCGWETCHCHCDIILDVKLRSQPHWIVPLSWIQELSPCHAGRALGGSLPAVDCHGILFCSQKWAWRLLRPCHHSVPQPLAVLWEDPCRQAIVMVSCFAVKNGHGGCSGHVIARSHSRFSCFGAFPAGRRWSW